jgi:hypothetical protein
LLLALSALILDGSNLFVQKRSVQNAVDAAAFAAAKDLPPSLSGCAGACLTTLGSDAQSYSGRNNGPTPLHACDDSSGPDTNCYLTPYKSDNGRVQVRLRKPISGFFTRAVGLWGATDVSGSAVAGLSPASAAGTVVPIGISASRACMASTVPSCFGVQTTLDFDAPGNNYSLVDLSDVSRAGPTPPGGASASTMKGWISDGYPGVLPSNAWYGDNNGSKNGGFKKPLEDAWKDQRVLLVPIFDSVSPAPPATPVSYHVIGFGAFVIDENPPNWNNSGNHYLVGHFTTVVASGGGAGGGTNNFGVLVVTLFE